MPTKKISIIIAVITILLFAGGYWYSTKNQPTTISQKSVSDITFATTTESGLPITITISPCDVASFYGTGNPAWHYCFGSGRSDYYEVDGIEVWNLVYGENNPRFGVFDIKHENFPYTIDINFGNHVPTEKEFNYFRNKMPELFKDHITKPATASGAVFKDADFVGASGL